MSKNIAGVPANTNIVKGQAKRLKSALRDIHEISHGQALELVAKMHGRASWGALNAEIGIPDVFHGPFNLGYAREKEPPVLASMNMEWTGHELSHLRKALKEDRPSLKAVYQKERLEEIIKNGSVAASFLPDFFYGISQSLGELIDRMDIDRLCFLFKIEKHLFFFRPSEKEQDGTYGIDTINLDCLARLMIKLEDMGFKTFPEPIVDAVNRKLAHDFDRTYLSLGELDCLWYSRERNRKRDLTFMAKDRADGEDFKNQVHVRRDGDRLTFRENAVGETVDLSIQSEEIFLKEEAEDAAFFAETDDMAD